MDKFIYSSITQYYDALSKLGYHKYGDVFSLLVLSFFRDFVYEDYRARLSREDYHVIEKALNCLFGSSCLIPYPDYLKMNKLHLGSMTEMAQRIKNVENTPVLKLVTDDNVKPDPNSDVKIIQRKKQ